MYFRSVPVHIRVSYTTFFQKLKNEHFLFLTDSGFQLYSPYPIFIIDTLANLT